MTSSEELTFLQRVLIKTWKELFNPDGSRFLPGLIDNRVRSLTHLPTDPSDPDADGFDLGRELPDMSIVTGFAPSGNATGFLPSGAVDGLRSLVPDVSPSAPEQAGLSFGDEDDGVSTLFAALSLSSALEVDAEFVIRQRLVRVAGGCCAGPPVAGMTDSKANMDTFRSLGRDLVRRGGEFGAWLVAAHRANQFSALFAEPAWKKAVARYDGSGVWQAVLKVLRTRGSVSLPQDQMANARSLLEAARSISSVSAKTELQRLAQTLDKLPPVLRTGAKVSTYDELLALFAVQEAPEGAPFKVAFARRARDESSYDDIEGTLSAMIPDAGVGFEVRVTAQDDGKPPELRCTTILLAIGSDDWPIEYSGKDFFDDVLIFLQETFKPEVAGQVRQKLVSVINDQDIRDGVTVWLNQEVENWWNSEV